MIVRRRQAGSDGVSCVTTCFELVVHTRGEGYCQDPTHFRVSAGILIMRSFVRLDFIVDNICRSGQTMSDSIIWLSGRPTSPVTIRRYRTPPPMSLIIHSYIRACHSININKADSVRSLLPPPTSPPRVLLSPPLTGFGHSCPKMQ